jgi:hypothetical protein
MFGCTISNRPLRVFPASLLILFLLGWTVPALDATDLPADAPQDALMAGPAEIQQMQDWAKARAVVAIPP